MLQFLEFVLKLLEPISKLLKFLPFPTRIAGALSALPPVIGAVQVGWRFLQDIGSEHKKRVLRERIVSLQGFLKSFPEGELSEDQTRAAHDARNEQAEAISQLAKLASARPAATAEPIRKRSWVRRAFLLYAPRPRALWILHGLYYFFLIQLLTLLFVSGMQVASGQLETFAEMMPALGMWALFVLVFWGLAADLDRSGVRSRNQLQRWLLLYAPERPGLWAWHVLFYISLLFLVPILGLLPEMIRTKEISDLFVIAVWLLLAWILKTTAMRRSERQVGPLERWLLLYAPERPGRWGWHVFFYISLLSLVGLLGLLPEMIRNKETSGLLSVTVWVLLAWVFRKAAARPDLSERKFGGLERWLLLYAPRKRWAWTLHILFWVEVAAVVSSIQLLVESAIGKEPIGVEDVYPLLSSLIITFLFWGLASDVEQERRRPPGVVRRLFLAYLPERRMLWVLHVLFYVCVLCVLDAFLILVDLASGQYRMEEDSVGTGRMVLETLVPVIAPLLYMVLIALFSRAMAVALEPWATKMPRWLTWFWLGHLPHGWLKQFVFLLSALVFYSSFFLWPLLLLIVAHDLRARETRTILIVTLLIVAAGFAGRWVARRLQSGPLLRVRAARAG